MIPNYVLIADLGLLNTLAGIVVPNLCSAFASLAVVTFISARNEYLWPVLVMQQSTSVVQVGIRSFMSAEGNDWGTLMAASAIACVPVVLIYTLLQKHVIDGFVRSGPK